MSEAGSTGSPVWFDISGAWAVHTVRHQETQCLFSDFEGGAAKKEKTCEQSNGPMDGRIGRLTTKHTNKTGRLELPGAGCDGCSSRCRVSTAQNMKRNRCHRRHRRRRLTTQQVSANVNCAYFIIKVTFFSSTLRIKAHP